MEIPQIRIFIKIHTKADISILWYDISYLRYAPDFECDQDGNTDCFYHQVLEAFFGDVGNGSGDCSGGGGVSYGGGGDIGAFITGSQKRFFGFSDGGGDIGGGGVSSGVGGGWDGIGGGGGVSYGLGGDIAVFINRYQKLFFGFGGVCGGCCLFTTRWF